MLTYMLTYRSRMLGETDERPVSLRGAPRLEACLRRCHVSVLLRLVRSLLALLVREYKF